MKVIMESFSALPDLKAFLLAVVATSFPFSPLEKVTLKNTFFTSCIFVLQDNKVNSNATTKNDFVFIKHLLILYFKITLDITINLSNI